MEQVNGNAAQPKTAKVLGRMAAALLLAAAVFQPSSANAAHGSGGGPHGGAPRGGGGGFHAGAFPNGGFHAGGFHSGGFHGGGFHRSFAGRHGGLAIGLGGIYAPYVWGYPYPDYGYPDYGYYQPYAAQYWYYCSDPAGYYPYVTQCNTGWQPVPAG